MRLKIRLAASILSAVTALAVVFVAGRPGVAHNHAATPAAAAQTAHAASGALDIYFVDVEGGQSTLIVTPARQSLLIDAGWAGFDGRDAERILKVAKLAGINRINFLLVTHYHGDHVGGVAPLAARIPIDAIYDRGPVASPSPAAQKSLAPYLEVVEKTEHHVAQPGDRIPLESVDVRVVTANGKHLEKSLPGGGQPNSYCADTQPIKRDVGENERSLGVLVTFGDFRFLDLGDLTWSKELELMCPQNPIGTVDAFLASHHADADANSKALAWAIAPRVAIINNAPEKGGQPAAWKRLENAPSHPAIWQLHYSTEGGRGANAPAKFIANPKGQPDRGHYLKLSAHPDGSFTMTNSGTGFTVTDPVRKTPAE